MMSNKKHPILAFSFNSGICGVQISIEIISDKNEIQGR